MMYIGVVIETCLSISLLLLFNYGACNSALDPLEKYVFAPNLRTNNDSYIYDVALTNNNKGSWLNCTGCFDPEQAKFSRIVQVKKDILAKLGLLTPPNITGVDLDFARRGPLGKLVREFDLDLLPQSDAPSLSPISHEDLSDDFDVLPEDDSFERVYSFATSGKHQEASYFEFSKHTMSSHLKRAHVNFFIRPPTKLANQKSPVLVSLNLFTVDRLLVHTKSLKMDAKSGGWDKFGVKRLLKEWFRGAKFDSNENSKKFGVYIEAKLNGENLVVIPEPGEENDAAHNMYMDLILEDREANRRKRSKISVDCNGEAEPRCCREPLLIDFSQFKWDWIIAPKTYMAYYCTGTCPFQYMHQYIHTYVAQSVGVGPCCTPAETEDITMVYFNTQMEVVVSKVPGMVVTRCGCA